jgi:drug/metabolite transporter, DME family
LTPALWRIAGAALLFASAGLVSRVAPADISAPTFGLARLLVGGMVLALFLKPRRLAAALASLPRAPLLLAAVTMALFQWTYFGAVADAGAGVATLISASASLIFADAIDAVRERQLPWSRAGAVCATVLSIVCVALSDGMTVSAVMLALMAGAAYATYTAAAARLEHAQEGGGLASTSLALLLGGLLLVPVATGNLMAVVSWQALLAVTYLGLVATAAAYALFVSSLGTVSTPAALAVLLVQPLVAVLAGAFVLGEPVNVGVFAGIALLVLGLGARVLGFIPSCLIRKTPATSPVAS